MEVKQGERLASEETRMDSEESRLDSEEHRQDSEEKRLDSEENSEKEVSRLAVSRKGSTGTRIDWTVRRTD